MDNYVPSQNPPQIILLAGIAGSLKQCPFVAVFNHPSA
jgi:hypothetical protein